MASEGSGRAVHAACVLGPITVSSPNVTYTRDSIEAVYTYETTRVHVDASSGSVTAVPVRQGFAFSTARSVPRTGVMIVGLGGNNGTTMTAGVLAHKHGLTWRTKAGEHKPDWTGSLTQASTVRLGSDEGQDVYVPFKSLLPMVDPATLVIGGWDISGMNMADAMARAAVLDFDLQRQLVPHMAGMRPLPSVYIPDFIAANQSGRADNLIPGPRRAQLDVIRRNIRDFKASNGLETVIVLWSANTERYAEVQPGVNDSAEALLAAIDRDEAEIAPSTLFATAAILEGCTYINGSPQNTFTPGVQQLATQRGVYIGGDDFKSGQTKVRFRSRGQRWQHEGMIVVVQIKSVLVDFLVSAGIKPVSIVSYNHLGNNDGKNLSAAAQFRSKEISKSSVVDDMVESNGMLYGPGEEPDHVVVIKYVPAVGDSKRAMDEYTSEIFMGGHNTIAMHNTCEDSLLAAPLMIDLIVIAELCERIRIRRVDDAAAAVTGEGERFHAVLSLLSYMLKAPLVPHGTPVINALFKQREALVNVFRACVGLPPENHMMLEHRIATAGTSMLPCLVHDSKTATAAAKSTPGAALRVAGVTHAAAAAANGGFGSVNGGSAAAAAE